MEHILNDVNAITGIVASMVTVTGALLSVLCYLKKEEENLKKI